MPSWVVPKSSREVAGCAAARAARCTGAASPTGPIRRRADLAQLTEDVTRQEETLRQASAALAGTRSRLDALEREAEATAARVTTTQDAERFAAGARDDAARKHAALKRE